MSSGHHTTSETKNQYNAKSQDLRNTLRVSMNRYGIYDESASWKGAAGGRESREVSRLGNAEGGKTLRSRAEHDIALVRERPDGRLESDTDALICAQGPRGIRTHCPAKSCMPSSKSVSRENAADRSYTGS